MDSFLRLPTTLSIMFLFVVWLFGIWMGGCQTQEQKEIKRLIGELQDDDVYVCSNAASTLGNIGSGAKDAVPTLIRVLQDQDWDVRSNAAYALGRINTPEALKAVKGYESQQ